MEKIINNLFDNAKNIYNLYQKIINTNDKNEKKMYIELITYLLKKEKKQLESLQIFSCSELFTQLQQLKKKLGFYSLDVNYNYSQINSAMLPYLRVLIKIAHIILDQADEMIDQEQEYDTEEEYIFDSIQYTLFLENLVRLVNLAQSEKKQGNWLYVKKPSINMEMAEQEIAKILHSLPYDIFYLDETLEKMFLFEYQENLSWKLFNTLHIYENEFNNEMLLKIICEYNANIAFNELNQLLSLRKTRTLKTAFLRSLNMYSALEGLEIDAFNDFIDKNGERIMNLDYPFTLIKRLQAVVEYEKGITLESLEEKVIKKRQQKKSIKQNVNPNGGGVN